MEVMPKATEKIRLKPRRPNKGDPLRSETESSGAEGDGEGSEDSHRKHITNDVRTR